MRILFVCMGNICRSPTAAGVFRRMASERAPELRLEIDSAGTHAYHIGEAPDRRAQAAALRRGIDLSLTRARQVESRDFERFDLILAMDRDNLELLRTMAPDKHFDRIRLLMDFAADATAREVPDPYYGGPKGFEQVLDLLEEAAEGLLEEILHRARQG